MVLLCRFVDGCVCMYLCVCCALWSGLWPISVSLPGLVWWQSAVSEQCTGQWYRQVHVCGCQRRGRTTKRVRPEGLRWVNHHLSVVVQHIPTVTCFTFRKRHYIVKIVLFLVLLYLDIFGDTIWIETSCTTLLQCTKGTIISVLPQKYEKYESEYYKMCTQQVLTPAMNKLLN